MQNILIVGLPSTGVTLMTKMLAKELSDRNKRVVIKDGSQTGRTFESFALNGLDVKSGLVDYDGIDIARSSIDVESYDVCLTEATIMEMNLTKEELQVFDQIVIVANGNIHRKMRTERFIKDNDLRNIKLIVNLSYIGDFDYADGYVDYVAFIGMDGRIQAIDAEGEKKG
ncbi:MAG: hypothetical protein JXO44_13145, partial [Clostridia bacterium]|nr:hypothetical protein [Clostridia bacterium]